MTKLIAALCCCALLTTTVIAQDNAIDSRQQWKTQTVENTQQAYIGSNKLVGSYVYGTDNESIGDFNSVVLDGEGKIFCAIVGVGGVAGVGESEIAVPWKAFRCECKMEDGEKCCRATLPMAAEQLKNAPKLEAAEYAELYDQDWIEKNARFYGVECDESAPKMGSLMCVTDINGLQLNGNTASTTAASDKRQKTYTSNSGESVDLGTIEEVVFDMTESNASYIIVGNNSGVLSEKHVAVPFSSVNFSMKDDSYRATVAATSKDMEVAPPVTPGEYKELELKSIRDRIENSFASR